MTTWRLDERDGALLVVTEREGPAARLGHRVTLQWTRWRAAVTETDGVPSDVRVDVAVDGVVVRSGEGGLKALGAVEKSMVRRTALRTLAAVRHHTIELRATSVVGHEGGYRLTGHLTICGITRPHAVTVQSTDTPDGVRYDVASVVRQHDFGIEPVSFFRGALVVSDEVTVRWTALRPQDR